MPVRVMAVILFCERSSHKRGHHAVTNITEWVAEDGWFGLLQCITQKTDLLHSAVSPLINLETQHD